VLIYDLGNGQWNIPKLRELLEKILPENTIFNDFEVEHVFDGIGPKIMHLNARRIYKDTQKTELILLAIEDVTNQEHYKRHTEEIVESRTADLVLAKQEADEGKLRAETALCEINELKKQLEAERAYLKEEIRLENDHENIIGQSDSLKYVLYKVKQIAESNTSVLVLGETGTGKELVARAIHGSSKRKKRALVKVNCAALPSNLIESELFGHEKGAFTSAGRKHMGRFEIADGATLFLDEIGELPLELQSKLLRVIQDGEFERLGGSHTIKVDARIIAATNRNLEEEVEKGSFRSDLWYRLNVFPITMPPLRERIEDIPLLVDFYIDKISRRLGKTIKIIPQNVMNALQNYHWPGNIRELENVLERAVINSSSPKLRLADDLSKSHKHPGKNYKTMEAVERDYIVWVLEQTHWKVSGKNSAAQILGFNRSTLRARMRKLGIVTPERIPFNLK
jgi:formate hydrogenlyase transcriptional activator